MNKRCFCYLAYSHCYNEERTVNTTLFQQKQKVITFMEVWFFAGLLYYTALVWLGVANKLETECMSLMSWGLFWHLTQNLQDKEQFFNNRNEILEVICHSTSKSNTEKSRDIMRGNVHITETSIETHLSQRRDTVVNFSLHKFCSIPQNKCVRIHKKWCREEATLQESAATTCKMKLQNFFSQVFLPIISITSTFPHYQRCSHSQILTSS